MCTWYQAECRDTEDETIEEGSTQKFGVAEGLAPEEGRNEAGQNPAERDSQGQEGSYL